jgi:electron transfer flavoprotein alpha subunit
MTTLLVAEHDNAALGASNAKAMSAAKALGQDVHVLVAGSNCKTVAEAAAKLDGASKVLLADAPQLGHALAEEMAALITGLMGGYDAVVTASTASGKNFMPRVAALLDVMQISDIIKVVTPDTFERPIYAGNAIQTVQSSDKKKVITVRTTAFPAVGSSGSASIETVAVPAAAGLSSFEKAEIQKSDRPELTAAKIVRARPAVGRELQEVHRAGRRPARRRRRCQPRGCRRGLHAERLPGRPDRQGGRA